MPVLEIDIRKHVLKVTLRDKVKLWSYHPPLLRYAFHAADFSQSHNSIQYFCYDLKNDLPKKEDHPIRTCITQDAYKQKPKPDALRYLIWDEINIYKIPHAHGGKMHGPCPRMVALIKGKTFESASPSEGRSRIKPCRTCRIMVLAAAQLGFCGLRQEPSCLLSQSRPSLGPPSTIRCLRRVVCSSVMARPRLSPAIGSASSARTSSKSTAYQPKLEGGNDVL